ncbi:HeH/LEM domain-containing protein [Paenisporosarcina cavernae]|uniref:HeH/LEM domain-containing protein n=1 Tax=Paenisporosarcina cavernae TaxID=2320858 RepID=A0A385YQQ8_9BACL|nr:HeH/LEM domain-containing protein [Paenisporosarcina cavernae]AYC28720.1 hypothetical protein D3873_02095 [Paenisporosarcina cavernae]
MTTYVKALDSIIKVVDLNGKEQQVTQRAYDVVYKAKGYKLVDGSLDNQKGQEGELVDYFTLSREELEKVKNDDLKAFLDQEEIEYPSTAKKEELIDLVLGE